MSVLARFALSVIAVGAASILAACGGGDDPLSLDAYFSEVERISVDVDERQAGLETQYAAALNAETFTPATRDGVADYVTAMKAVSVDFARELRDIEPPDEVQDEHREALEAFDDLPARLDSLVIRLQSVQSMDDLIDAFTDPDFSSAVDRTNVACAALQSAADDRSIDVDLQCED